MRYLAAILLSLVTLEVRAENTSVELAAKAGFAWAQYKLGEFYYSGDEGYPVDYVRAAEWYEKSARNGHAKGQLATGIAYRRGQGVGRSTSTAIYWMKKSAAQSHGLAMYNLALVYQETGDAIEAYAWALLGRDHSEEATHRYFCTDMIQRLDRELTRAAASAGRDRSRALASELGL
jgi:TPR repeat protein